MHNTLRAAVIALGLAGASFVMLSPASAAVVGVNVGPVGLGFTVGNGHYYDRNHRYQSYTYPSDWQTYRHPQEWYQSHPQWNNQKHADWYRN
jgi:hypothetical protein